MTARTYPDWETCELPRRSEADDVRSQIDALMQTAETAEQWLKINWLCKTIGDEPPFRFDYSPYERMVMVSRADWDLGMPSGMGRTEAEAIADLFEQEDNS